MKNICINSIANGRNCFLNHYVSTHAVMHRHITFPCSCKEKSAQYESTHNGMCLLIHLLCVDAYAFCINSWTFQPFVLGPGISMSRCMGFMSRFIPCFLLGWVDTCVYVSIHTAFFCLKHCFIIHTCQFTAYDW